MDIDTGGLEVHIEEILRSHKDAWIGYKTYLASLYSFSRRKQGTAFEFREGDSSIRFDVTSIQHPVNRLFYIYELGSVIPTVRWRMLVKSRVGLSPIILRQKVSFLPAFSYTLDKPLTFIYWGGKEMLLDPRALDQLDITNILLEVAGQVEISAANVAWPRKIEHAYTEFPSLEELTRFWIFNTLVPPNLKTQFSFWADSPFVLVGNTSIEAISLHKTFARIDPQLPTRMGPSGIVIPGVEILNRNLETAVTTCESSEATLKLLSSNKAEPVLLCRRVVVNKSPEIKPHFHNELHPLDLSALLGSETPAPISTLVSMVLRSMYLEKQQGTVVADSLGEVRSRLSMALRQKIFRTNQWDEFASRVIDADPGLDMIVRLLRVYKTSASRVEFLHPSMVDCALIMTRGLERSKDSLFASLVHRVHDAALSAGIETGQPSSISTVFAVQDGLGSLEESPIDFRTARAITSLLEIIFSEVLPLSKALIASTSST